MTESNTNSDLGQKDRKLRENVSIKAHGKYEVRHLTPIETPRERMLRVTEAAQQKRKK